MGGWRGESGTELEHTWVICSPLADSSLRRLSSPRSCMWVSDIKESAPEMSSLSNLLALSDNTTRIVSLRKSMSSRLSTTSAPSLPGMWQSARRSSNVRKTRHGQVRMSEK